MPRIEPIRQEQASGRQKQVLEEIEQQWGNSWNVMSTIAASSNMIVAFKAFYDQLFQSSLSNDDRETIALFLGKVNGCHYCVPAHVSASREEGIPESEIAAILKTGEPKDPRRHLVLDALKVIMETKGGMSDAQFKRFQDAGLTPENLIDIIGEIAHCTITNYTNRLAQTELDDFLKTVPPAVTPEGMDEPEIKKYPLRPPKVG